MRTLLKAAAAVAAIGLAGLPGAAAAGPYYEGKTVTMIVPNTPAGAQSQYARMVAPYLAKHLGAKDVRVDNQPGAGGLRGTNVLWRAKPDGLTIIYTIMSSMAMAQLAESPGVQFDFGKFVFLGGTTVEPRVLLVGAQNKDIKSIQDVLKMNRDFIFPTQGTDDDFYVMALLFDAIGKKLKTVTGYEGDADTSLAVIKGDGDGHMSSWATTGPSLRSGEKRAILNMAATRWPDAPDVPSVLEIVKEGEGRKVVETIIAIQSLHRGMFGPPGMDPAAVAEMRAAIKATLEDPELIAESQKKQLPLHFVPGEEQQATVTRVLEVGESLKPKLKAALAAIK